MRIVMLCLALLLVPMLGAPVQAQTRASIGIGDHGVSLGFVISTYPTLQRIPGFPVYYGPQLDLNYFFYDGLYWVFVDDDWYASSWYDGPWDRVYPAEVPLFVLRIPVRYYRRPPPYFRRWRPDAPPRWEEHWGYDWSRQHPGWDRWNRRTVPRPVPLPTYQRDYVGQRYPRQREQQRAIELRHDHYPPRESPGRPTLHERRSDEAARDRRPCTDEQPSAHAIRPSSPPPPVRYEPGVRQSSEPHAGARQDLPQRASPVRPPQERRLPPPPRATAAPKVTDGGGKDRADKRKGRAHDDQGRDGHPPP